MLSDSTPHLLGRLASMRDTQDAGIGITAMNAQGFGGQRLRLARAGSRDHDRWTVDRPDRRFLLGVDGSGYELAFRRPD